MGIRCLAAGIPFDEECVAWPMLPLPSRRSNRVIPLRGHGQADNPIAKDTQAIAFQFPHILQKREGSGDFPARANAGGWIYMS